MKKRKVCLFLLPLLFQATFVSCKKATTVSITYNQEEEPVKFSISEIKNSLKENGYQYVDRGGDYQIRFEPIDSSLGREAYSLKKNNHEFIITGGNTNGLMYGGLQLAESINVEENLDNIQNREEGESYLEERGLNVRPAIDMRTPAYTNQADCVRLNEADSWNLDYWQGLFDNMARMRYNTLSINSLNCLASMIEVPGYEQCALQDVWKYTGEYDDSYLGNASNMFRKEQIESGQYEVIKKMTIKEKTKFWYDVFEAAKNRGIQISFSAMNIYTFAEEYYHCYGITNQRDNEVTKDYLYKGYKTLLETFPQITTLDSGTGENMDYPADTITQSEDWVYDVYGRAVKDFIQEHPERAGTMTYGSSYLTSTGMYLSDAYLEKLKDFPCKVQITARYNDTHLYSVTKSRNQKEVLARLPSNARIFYRLKTDDSYHLTWGDPDFARELCRNIKDSQNRVSGYYFGGDGYNYVGKEYEFVDDDLNGDYYTNRHWVNFTMMGRFGYNPDGMTDEYLGSLFRSHYKSVSEENCKNAWEAMNMAGKVLPQVLHLHQPGGTDSAFLAELCWSHPSLFGFLDIKRFVNSDLADPDSNTMSIREYALALQNGETKFTKETPFDVVDNLRKISSKTMEYVNDARKDIDKITDKKFKSLVTDQEAFAILGNYYADKFSAAMNLRIYNDSKDESYHTKAISDIELAAEVWKTYSALWSSRFKVERLARHGVINPVACNEKADKDVDIVKNWKPRKLS